MEKNETGCQAPAEAPILCINNCGFFGTLATMNMCSKCHKNMILKQENAKPTASSIESIVNGKTSLNISQPFVAPSSSAGSELVPLIQPSAAPPAQDDPSRCTACRKRVGLTGFGCRCGNVFCSVHRYSDKHDCPFDYRTTAKDVIAKMNPVVKAQKLDKI